MSNVKGDNQLLKSFNAEAHQKLAKEVSEMKREVNETKEEIAVMLARLSDNIKQIQTEMVEIKDILKRKTTEVPVGNHGDRCPAREAHNRLLPNAQQPQSRCLRVEDALSFLDEVKLTFANQTHIYIEFLDTMKEFQLGLLDTPSVLAAVSALFKDQPDLIRGFSVFCPPGYKPKVPGF